MGSSVTGEITSIRFEESGVTQSPPI